MEPFEVTPVEEITANPQGNVLPGFELGQHVSFRDYHGSHSRSGVVCWSQRDDPRIKAVSI